MRSPLTTSEYSSNLAPSRPASVYPNLLDHSLQVHLHTRSNMASKRISKLARLRPASLHHHDHQVHLQTRSITSFMLAWSSPLSAYLHTPSIMASKWISKLTRLQLPSSHDSGLQVRLQTCSITISPCISMFTYSSFWGAPPIAPKHRLQPVQIYRV